jgi:hypothetical protein
VDFTQVGASEWERTRVVGDKIFGRLSSVKGRDFGGGTLYDGEVKAMFGGAEFETRYPWGTDGPCMVKVGKKKAGRLLDGRAWDEMPKVSPS